jgi:hypothetical protein
MESQVKLPPFVRFVVHSLMAVVLLAMVALPLSADTITVKSDASNTGTSVGADPYGHVSLSNSATDSVLFSGNISGLTFTPVGTVSTGSWAAAAFGAPIGTIQVQVPPQPGLGALGNSGLVETTFVLPTGYSGASLSGVANVDDWGYVFLNGNLISDPNNPILSTSNSSFGTSDAAYFLTGLNTLVISDINEYGGPSGVAFYANINYSTSGNPDNNHGSNATPEPSSMIMLATGLVGLVGAIRRKLA